MMWNGHAALHTLYEDVESQNVHEANDIVAIQLADGLVMLEGAG